MSSRDDLVECIERAALHLRLALQSLERADLDHVQVELDAAVDQIEDAATVLPWVVKDQA
jgi:hypothetical protein